MAYKSPVAVYMHMHSVILHLVFVLLGWLLLFWRLPVCSRCDCLAGRGLHLQPLPQDSAIDQRLMVRVCEREFVCVCILIAKSHCGAGEVMALFSPLGTLQAKLCETVNPTRD